MTAPEPAQGVPVPSEPAGRDDYPSALTDAYRATEGADWTDLGNVYLVLTRDPVRPVVYAADTVEVGRAGELEIVSAARRTILAAGEWTECRVVLAPEPEPTPWIAPRAAAVPAELYPPAGVPIQP